MARVLPRAVGVAPTPEGPSAYDLLMQEFQRLQEEEKAPVAPQFTPEQQAERIRQNNQEVMLGLAGAMSGDESMRGVGGNIFKRGMAGRDEVVDKRGTYDPLTGELRESPEYQRERRDARADKLLNRAVAFQTAQQADNTRRELANQRVETAALIAANKPIPPSQDPEMIALRKQLTQAQIDALKTEQAKKEQAAADAAAKAAGAKDKAVNAAQAASNKAQIVIDQANTALKQSGRFTTGAMGKVFSKIPGTTAFDLENTIETIKANIGFEELNAMRQASPTGGALGQVAVQELNYLQATLGNLNTGQGRDQFEKNLKAVKKHFENWKKVMVEHAKEQGASAGELRQRGPLLRRSTDQRSGGTTAVPAQGAPATAGPSADDALINKYLKP